MDLNVSVTATTTVLPDGNNHYFHVATLDNAGNWTSTTHIGPFVIDTELPINPSSVTEVNGALNNNLQLSISSPTFIWSGAADNAGSGIAGSYYYFGTDKNGTSSNYTVDSRLSVAGVSGGTYYLRLATKDNAGNISNWETVFIFKYSPPLKPNNSWDSGGTGSWSWDASKIARGDFDGDGNDDIVALYGYEAQREVKAFFFKGNSQGGFDTPKVWWSSGPGNWDWEGSMLTSGDYNGDGRWDLGILYGYATQRDVRAFVFLSDGSRFNGAQVWWHAGAGNWDWAGSVLESGDFNGDDKTDLAILYGYAAQRDVVAFVFPSSGTSFSTSQVWWRAGAGNWDWAGSKLSVGDYTGDGKDDLSILYGYETQRDVASFVFPSTGSRFSASQMWWRAGAGNWDWKGSRVTSGDYTGDGADDLGIFYGYGGSQSAIFVFPSTTSRFKTSSIWYNSGPGNWSWASTKILSGDFDGSGADEIVGFYNYGGSHAGLYVFR